MTTTLTPTTTTTVLDSLAAALMAAQPAHAKHITKAVAALTDGTPYDFDGVELRVLSRSERAAGIWHITDGQTCTCPGGRHPTCYHRKQFALLFAQAALCDPLGLRASIIEQCVDPDPAPPPFDGIGDADYLDAILEANV